MLSLSKDASRKTSNLETAFVADGALGWIGIPGIPASNKAFQRSDAGISNQETKLHVSFFLD